MAVVFSGMGGNRARRWIQVGVSATVAVGAAGALMWWSTTHQQLVPDLVAARELPAFSVMQDSDLTVKQVPAGSVDPGTVQNRSALVGKMLVSPVYPGESVRAERVADATGIQVTGGRTRVVARPGERLVSLACDQSAAALQTGDVVDLYVVPNAVGGGTTLVVAGGTVAELRTGSGQIYAAGAGTTAPPAVMVVRLQDGQVRDVLDGLSRGKVVAVRR